MFTRPLFPRPRSAFALGAILRQPIKRTANVAPVSGALLRCRSFCHSRPLLAGSEPSSAQPADSAKDGEGEKESSKSNRPRSPATKISLRRAAVEAERSKDGRRKRQVPEEGFPKSKVSYYRLLFQVT